MLLLCRRCIYWCFVLHLYENANLFVAQDMYGLIIFLDVKGGHLTMQNHCSALLKITSLDFINVHAVWQRTSFPRISVCASIHFF